MVTVLATDHPESGIGDLSIRVAAVHVIEHVLCLKPQLQVTRFVLPQAEFLHQREVPLAESRAHQPGGNPAHIADLQLVGQSLRQLERRVI